MSTKPLSGIRVLDFTALPPGGMATVMLADLGAEVIRVESPALKGQPSLIFGQVAMSRGKKSLTLDLVRLKSGWRIDDIHWRYGTLRKLIAEPQPN